MPRVFTAEIISATKQVVATNESDAGVSNPPVGRAFVVYDPALAGDPNGKYYVVGSNPAAFQVNAP